MFVQYPQFMIQNRKKEHIDLAFKSYPDSHQPDPRFDYEPLLEGHPLQSLSPVPFLGKQLQMPLWVSSMTGGTEKAGEINRNLAKACSEFGLGMGLGSCRILLEDDRYFSDFNMRPIIGDDYPLYANLGISQIEMAALNGTMGTIRDLVDRLSADGLIIHINPAQEWLQQGGDRQSLSAIETIKRACDFFQFPLIVKEVGQGMGPRSLAELMKLPLAAVEFGAYGGANFATIEIMRSELTNSEILKPLARLGHNAAEMLSFTNQLAEHSETLCRELIISGGLRDFLDGFYLTKRSVLPAIYGQASVLLKYASVSYDALHDFLMGQEAGLRFANAFLRVKE